MIPYSRTARTTRTSPPEDPAHHATDTYLDCLTATPWRLSMSRHGQIARPSNRPAIASGYHVSLSRSHAQYVRPRTSSPPHPSSYAHTPHHAVPLHTDAVPAGYDSVRPSQSATPARRSNARRPIARTAVRGGRIRASRGVAHAPCAFPPSPRRRRGNGRRASDLEADVARPESDRLSTVRREGGQRRARSPSSPSRREARLRVRI